MSKKQPNFNGGKMKSNAQPKKPFCLTPNENGDISNMYEIAVAAGLIQYGEMRTFESRDCFNDALVKKVEDRKAIVGLCALYTRKGWDFKAFLEEKIRSYIRKYGLSPNKAQDFIQNCKAVGVDFVPILDKECERARVKAQKAFAQWRNIVGGKVYTNIVLAVPHAVSELSFDELTQSERVRAEVARWTDWYTDELFEVKHGKISCVKFPYSRVEVDAERLKGEADRIAAFRLPEKGAVVKEVSAQRWNKYLAAWFRYRVELLEAAALGEKPLIIDCHSFPADLDPEVDVCLGFNEDATKPSGQVIANVKELFEDAGYRVAINTPYSNAIAPVDYRGQSLMIELNKQTYMSDDLKKNRVAFEKMQETLLKVYSYLLGENIESRLEEDEGLRRRRAIEDVRPQQLRINFDKPHKCPHCEKSFLTKDELRNHVELVHPNLDVAIQGMDTTVAEEMKQRNLERTRQIEKERERDQRMKARGGAGVLG